MTADPFYFSKPWRRLRAIVLREEPTCRLCQKAHSVIADHIIPRRLRPDLALVRENVQALCKLCHDGAKQQLERSGTLRGCDENGIPLDPGHHWRTAR